MKQKQWYYLIDGIRGFALINMVLFHFLYDIFIVFRYRPNWTMMPYAVVWQQFICITFIFISGISWHFSRNNLKRGLLLNLYGIIITIVTALFIPSEIVLFGILNFMGCATLLLLLLHRWLKKVPPVWGLLLSMLLFILCRTVQEGFLSFFHLPLAALPQWLYDIRILTFVGMPYPGFSSSDFFPLLPWFFLFTAGYWSWELICHKETILKLCSIKLPVLSAIGTKSIWIYMAHQPVLYGLAWLMAFYFPR